MLLLAVVFLLLFFVRQRYVHIPFERDEGEYAYAGSLLLHGHLPYRDAYNMKFPGTYFMYSLIMQAGGESIEAIRYGIIITVLLTCIGIGAIVVQLKGSFLAGFVAAAVYMVLVGTVDSEGLMANSEHFVNLFAVLGIWAVLKYKNAGLAKYLFAAGFFLALAIVMKQYGYAFSLFAGIVLLTTVWRRQPGAVLRVVFFFTLGYVIVFAALFSWLLYHGLWNKFVFLTIKYAYAYLGLSRGNVAKSIAQLVTAAPTVWILIVAALLIMFWFIRNPSSRFLLVWLAFSILALSTGYNFRIHYFMLAYPALAVITGIGFYTLLQRFEWGSYIVTAACMLLFFFMRRDILFFQSPTIVFSQHYQWGMFQDMPALGSYIKQLVPPAERLSMFSNEPELYFYSNRLSASGYIYNYALFECQPYSGQMVKEYIQQIESNPSPYFIYHSGSIQVCNTEEYTKFENWRTTFLKDYALISVYRPLSMDSSAFLTADEILSENEWKNGLRIEFWKRKL